MVTSLHNLANRDFYRALKELRGLNVLLLLVDGSAVFGRLEGINDCIVNVLPPFGLAGVISVRLRPPNADLPFDILLDEMLIDVLNVAAVIDGPFLFSPLSKTDSANCSVKDSHQAAKTKTCYRQTAKLASDLQQFQGRNIGVMLLGGWVIGGQLWDVSDCMVFIVPGTMADDPPLITIGSINIFGPALAGGALRLFGAFRSWINLKVLTATLFP